MSDMTRRDFAKMSAKGMALISVPLLFKADPLAALAGLPAEGGKLADYYTHFGVDEDLIRKVMAVALERGGDYCDVYFQHQINNWIGLEDNDVNRAYSNVDFGVGIRVLEGDQTGYSFTEEITPEAMKMAAKTAANIASQSKNAPPTEYNQVKCPDYYPIKTAWEDVGIDQKIPYLQRINDRVFAADKRVIKSKIWFEDESSYVLMATSDGKIAYDYRPMTTASVSVTAEQDGKREKSWYGRGPRAGIEYFTPDVVNYLADEAVRRTVELFDAVKPEGGEMEVVLAAGNSGILLHEAIGHGMEADFNRKGISIFADKIGKSVAKDFVTIVDDATLPNMRGSINVDDEANATEKTYLVKDGILKSYLHDHISSKHYGVNPTGNGRRQSFRHVPIPRMRNTYMLPGPHTKEEIIKSVKKGIYTESFTNGQVNIGAGDFTFYVQTGYMIEDGKMTAPVKDINIIGNGPKVLSDIVMVGDDLKQFLGGGYCGKDGQRCLVSDGLPTCKVSSITVGGVSS